MSLYENFWSLEFKKSVSAFVKSDASLIAMMCTAYLVIHGFVIHASFSNTGFVQ